MRKILMRLRLDNRLRTMKGALDFQLHEHVCIQIWQDNTTTSVKGKKILLESVFVSCQNRLISGRVLTPTLVST
jgi:hypothetical protein